MSDTHQGTTATGPIEIDAGVRAWYASCRCCLSDAHPEAVAILDADDAEGTHRAEGTIQNAAPYAVEVATWEASG